MLIGVPLGEQLAYELAETLLRGLVQVQEFQAYAGRLRCPYNSSLDRNGWGMFPSLQLQRQQRAF